MPRWIWRNSSTRSALRDLRAQLKAYRKKLDAFHSQLRPRLSDKVILALCDIVCAQAEAVVRLERTNASGATLDANVRAGFEAAIFARFIASSPQYEADAITLYVFDEFEHADYMAKYAAAFPEDLDDIPERTRTRESVAEMIGGSLNYLADYIEAEQPAAAATMRARTLRYERACKEKKLPNDPFGGMRQIRDAIESHLADDDDTPTDHSAKLEMIYSLLSAHAHPRPRIGNPIWRAENPIKVRAGREREIGQAVHLAELTLGYGLGAFFAMERQGESASGAAQ